MKSIVVANWKMNPQTMQGAKQLFEATRKAADAAKNVSLIVAPPSIFLRELRSAYKGKKIAFAAQNAHAQGGGAYTGEISMSQVKDAKAAAVVIGHAERRAMGEGNEEVRAKLQAALAHKLQPILCVGESKRTPNGEHFTFIKEELRAALADVAPGNLGRILVAYEPVWAIGAASAMSPRDMHEMAIFIRKSIVEMHGEKGRTMKILYGGSIDESNAREMIAEGDVQGLLVGRASTEAEGFARLVKTLA